MSTAIADAHDTAALKRRLKAAERWRQLKSAGLVAPLLGFILVFFLLPIAGMLWRAIDNHEVAAALPRMTAAIAQWNGNELPDEPVFAALAADLAAGRGTGGLARAAQQLNIELNGLRSALINTGRRAASFPEGEAKARMLEIDSLFGQTTTWIVLRKATSPLTSYHLLAAMDMQIKPEGGLASMPADRSIYLGIFWRTFEIAGLTTLFCLLLGYPLAFWLTRLPPSTANLMMILVLLPFWTSILVRTTAWFVILQREGMVNDALMWLGLINTPLTLVFNRFAVYAAMVHVLLPFMVLPLYSVMRSIHPAYMRAATSLGAPPVTAFRRIYLPLTLPGIGAGGLIVFIQAIGYYITPALVGGPDDQMISYFIAFNVTNTANWGLAAALGVLLLLLTLALYVLYDKLVGIDRLRLG